MTPNEITLREYIESRFHASQRELQEFKEYHHREHAMIQAALSEAKSDMNLRLEGMNEFRAQLTEQKASFITKEQHESLEARVAAQEKFKNQLWGVIMAAMALSAFIQYLVQKAMATK